MENRLTAKDKIILVNVEPLKDQQSGFKVHDESKQWFLEKKLFQKNLYLKEQLIILYKI